MLIPYVGSRLHLLPSAPPTQQLLFSSRLCSVTEFFILHTSALEVFPRLPRTPFSSSASSVGYDGYVDVLLGLSPPWHGSALPELEPYLSPVARWSHLVIDRRSEHPYKRVGFKATYDHILRALFGCSIYIDRATVSLTLPERSLRAPRLRPPPSRRVTRDVDLRTGIESFAARDSVQGLIATSHGKSTRRAEKFERSGAGPGEHRCTDGGSGENVGKRYQVRRIRRKYEQGRTRLRSRTLRIKIIRTEYDARIFVG